MAGILNLALVSEKYKYSYLVIPKNACTTIKQWHININNLGFGSIHRLGISDTSYFKNGYTRFTVLRNPYQRFISGYCNKFIRSTFLGKNENVANTLCNQLNIKKHFSDVSIIELLNAIKSADKINWHFATQSSLIKGLQFDYFLRFENFNNNFKIMCEKESFPYFHIVKNKTNYNENKYADLTEWIPKKIITDFGAMPSFDCFSNKLVFSRLDELYSDDIKLYVNTKFVL